MINELHDISDRLSGIAEEIADLVFEQLRESVEAGATKPSDTEKRMARARSAVLKAEQLLRQEIPAPEPE